MMIEVNPTIGSALNHVAEVLLLRLASVDPAPLFSLSLLPYLAFLWWAQRSGRFPRLALIGFRMTLVFVAVTIVAAIVAERRYGRMLADVDGLHGAAESLLTVSNLLVLLGFRSLGSTAAADEQVLRHLDAGQSAAEDGASASAP